jgi:DNA-binding transcriptional LysR family regulator
VVSGRLDAAIVVNPVRHPDLVIKELCQDTVRLWKIKNCINPKVLLVEPNLLQTQDIMRKLSKLNFSFEQVIESSSLEVLTHLMLSGTGYAILPERVVKSISTSKAIAEEGAPFFVDHICFVYKVEFKLSKTGKVFIDRLFGTF